MEGGQVSPGAGLRLKPDRRAAARSGPLRLAVTALLFCACPTVLAQNAPPPPVEAPASPPAAAGEKPADDSNKVKLPGVNVQGKRDVFGENDRRLKQLQDSLPCAGCDAKPHTKKKLVNRVLDTVGDRVLPTEAPDHSNREANDKAEELSKDGVCSAASLGQCAPGNARP
ncbi:MAG: hypothetical protein P4L83_20430 [Nevskia sp.]|nr:hypothetical protein [Nevskia sp.]